MAGAAADWLPSAMLDEPAIPGFIVAQVTTLTYPPLIMHMLTL